MLTCLGLKIFRWLVAYYIQKQCRKAKATQISNINKIYYSTYENYQKFTIANASAMLPFHASTTSLTLLRLIQKFNTFMFIYNILVSSCEKLSHKSFAEGNGTGQINICKQFCVLNRKDSIIVTYWYNKSSITNMRHIAPLCYQLSLLLCPVANIPKSLAKIVCVCVTP
jgi:hypothetical protein